MENSNLKIEELINWTDEQCENFDSTNKIKAVDVREIVKKWDSLSKDYVSLYNQLNELQSILRDGRMMGYQISCPNCKVTYEVKPEELNYNVEITCQDCGEKYLQNKNIFGIYLREINNASQE